MIGTDIAQWLADANARTHALVEGLSSEAWIGPKLEIVNPPQWEVAHVGWFQENFVLRKGLGCPPLREDADGFWDSIAIPHAERWTLPLPRPEEALAFLDAVHDRVQEELSSNRPELQNPVLREVLPLALFHQDMHNEAFAYTWQTLGYAAPEFVQKSWQNPASEEEVQPGDVEFDAGEIQLGATRDGSFHFDNERWSHPVSFDAFGISKLAVTAGEFAAFVAEEGYARQELWSDEGWWWREAAGLVMPCYWRKDDRGEYERRLFDRWIPLTWDLPVVHVSWHEAQAYCRWAGRRLPTEAEWEVAASSGPWQAGSPDDAHGNLDFRHGGVIAVEAFPAGDTPQGCRQMFGNVWEWTSSSFEPYSGFEPGIYVDYSKPWFSTRKVLRGGAWCTMARMMRNGVRNFYEPHRNDVWSGFRTCRTEG